MRIYTEVVWKWDDTKGEIVEVSSESFDYKGPLVRAEIATATYFAIAAASAAILGTAMQIKGGLDASAAKAKLGGGRAKNVLSENRLKNTILTKNAKQQMFDITRQGQWQEDQFVKESEKAIASGIAQYRGTKKKVSGIQTQTFTNAYSSMMDMMLGKQAIRYNTEHQVHAIGDNLTSQIQMNDMYAQNASWEYMHGAEASREAGNINALSDLTAGIGTYASIESKTPTGWWDSKPAKSGSIGQDWVQHPDHSGNVPGSYHPDHN